MTTPLAISAVVLASSLTWADAETVPTPLSEYQKQDWQVEDGLPQSNVRSIARSPGGPLLVATSGGMVAFDGLRFTPLKVDDKDELANESVNALLFSSERTLWIGTDDRGLIRRRGQTTVEFSENAGLHQERVRAIFEDREGTVWVATQNGVERIVGDKVERLTAPGIVSGDITSPFAADRHGNVFIVTSKGLFVWRSFAALPFSLGNPALGAPTAAFADAEGTVWIGRAHGLVRLIPGSRGSYTEVVERNIVGPVTTIVQDHNGYVWVGTRTNGLCRVSGNQVAHFTMADGLPDNTVRSLFTDDEGNLWIGTIAGGLSRWRESLLVPFGIPEGLPQSVAANVLADKHGNVWLGTWGSGLLRIQEGKLRQEHLPGTPLSVPIRALNEDHYGNIWIGTWFNGLYRYNGSRFQHFLIGTESPSNAISAILTDRRGALWIGTYKGLISFRQGIPQANRGEPFLQDKLITSLKETRDGSILVGTFTGLYLLNGSNVQAITREDGLSNDFIVSISIDSSGGVWVGTKAGGVDYVQDKRAIHLAPQTGIPGYPVFSVLDDGTGSLWMSTTRGVLRVPAGQLHDLVEGKRANVDSVLLGKDDGMRSSECTGVSQPPAAKANDGTLWFATAKGFVHTSIPTEKYPIPPPEVQIQGFVIDNTSLPPSDHLRVPAALSDVEFQFSAIRLTNPHQIQFRYKLEGYDRDWTVVRGRHARYKRITPGHYRFLVTAHDDGMPWSDLVASVEVEKLPFFYQTYWFHLLLVTSLSGLIALLFRRRVAQVKERMAMIMEERNRISSEWHDTLLADFAAIAWQLEATREKFNVHPDAASSLDLARNMVRHCQAEARRIIWDLREKPVTAGPLSEVLSRKLDTINEETAVAIQLSVSGEEGPIVPLAIQHLVCICQEAVTNAIRHAAPKLIEIGLEYSEERIKLFVRDDGRGFQPARLSASANGHFGISVMRERARKLGGHFDVQSSVGDGTAILVDIPSGAWLKRG